MKKRNVIFLLSLALTLCACSAPVELPDDDEFSVTTIKKTEVDTALSDSPKAVDPALLRDNTPVCLETSAPGLCVDGNDFASVDYSNAKDGYIMVEYFGSSPKVKLQLVGPNGITYTYDIQTGQAAFPLTSGAGDYEVSVCENIEGTAYSLAYKGSFNVPEVSEFGPYLHPNQYVYFTQNCKTVAKGAELAASCTNELDVVTNIYNYITKNITYDYDKANNVKSGYISNVDEILDSGTGICLDYSAVMTSMLRTQRIPTRLEVGYVGKDMVYHAWISVYITDVGWLNGIIQFDGKEWSLVDPTFGASTNERTLKEYIGDGTNYSTKYVY